MVFVDSGAGGHRSARDAGKAGGQQRSAGQDQQGSQRLPGEETSLLPTVRVYPFRRLGAFRFLGSASLVVARAVSQTCALALTRM